MTTIRQLYVEDLARSGITEKQARSAGFELHQFARLTDCPSDIYPKGAGYTIPYPGIKEFYRYRYLGTLPKTKAGKDIKYSQPKNSGHHIYLPKFNWAAVEADASLPIIITEGEKKALAASMRGHATVGVGGVFSWSGQDTRTLSDELLRFVVPGRAVYVALDSDVATNPQVCLAQARLCQAISAAGATPIPLTLDGHDGAKQGLDDWLLAHTPEDFSDLLAAAAPTPRHAAMMRMNAECALISDPPCVAHGRVLKKPADAAFYYANLNFIEDVVTVGRNGDARIGTKTFNAYHEWAKWPGRRAHVGLALRPAEGEVTHDNRLNMFKGWTRPALHPATQKDVAPFLWLVDRVCQGDGEKITAVLQFAAWSLQHPGRKLSWALLLHGRGNGTGKGLLADCIASTRGASTVEMPGSKLGSSFNSETAYSTLIRYNEMSEMSSNVNVYAELKDIVSSPVRWINQKGITAYPIENELEIIVTDNGITPLTITEYDRRLLVIHVTTPQLTPAEVKPIREWLNGANNNRGSFAGVGPALLTRYLLDYDLEDLTQDSPPPRTEDLLELANAGSSVLDAYVKLLKSSPDEALVFGKAVLSGGYLTLAQLKGCLDTAYPDNRVSTKTFAARLRHFGFTMAYKGLLVLCRDGTSRRLWCVRDARDDLSGPEIADYYASSSLPGAHRPIGAARRDKKILEIRRQKLP